MANFRSFVCMTCGKMRQTRSRVLDLTFCARHGKIVGLSNREALQHQAKHGLNRRNRKRKLQISKGGKKTKSKAAKPRAKES